MNNKLKHGSLFSGIGGFDLAAEWAGWENVFHCEWNEFGRRILEYYWPKAKTYEDITKTDFTIHRGEIDVLTGGFPCQPYSVAGKRKGKDDERHLWPEMLRAIREIAPRWVVGENVYGLVNWNDGMVFEEVQAQLENEGYQVQPYILPACSVNAPHKRDRIWFVAYAYDIGGCRAPRQNESSSEKKRVSKRDKVQQFSESSNLREFPTYSNNTRTHDTIRSDSKRPPQNERRENRSQPKFRESSRFNNPRTWEKFPTQTPICNGDDGLSSRLDAITFPKWRSESIKGGGNAIVPQVALNIFKSINEYENL